MTGSIERGAKSSGRWTWVVLGLWLAACGGRQQPPPAEEHPGHAAEVLAAMSARMEGVERLRIRAVVEYYGDGGRARARQVLLAERPDRLRAETLSPFDAPLSVLVANERELVLYDVGAERYWRGAPSAENVARLVPIRLAPSELVQVLLGGPPVDPLVAGAENAPVAWDGRRGGWRMALPLTDGSELVLVVAHGAWELRHAELRDPAGLVWELRVGDGLHVEEAGVALTVPRRFRFLMPAENVDLSLEVERVELNPTLSEFLFELDPPRGVRVEEL